MRPRERAQLLTVAHALTLRVAQVLTQSWIAPLVGEAVIINGSGAYLNDDGAALGSAAPIERAHSHTTAHTPRVSVVQADNHAWKRFRATACSHTSSKNATALAIAASTTNRTERASQKPCCRMSGYLTERNNEERLLHQHLGLRWCAGAIRRHERVAAATYVAASGSPTTDATHRQQLRQEQLQWQAARAAAAPAAITAVSAARTLPQQRAHRMPRFLHVHPYADGGAPTRLSLASHEDPPATVPDSASVMGGTSGRLRGSHERDAVDDALDDALDVSRLETAFEMVVFARPDLVWWAPLLAWCEFAWRNEMLACVTRSTCTRIRARHHHTRDPHTTHRTTREPHAPTTPLPKPPHYAVTTMARSPRTYAAATHALDTRSAQSSGRACDVRGVVDAGGLSAHSRYHMQVRQARLRYGVGSAACPHGEVDGAGRHPS
jgi:hypothetical protein